MSEELINKIKEEYGINSPLKNIKTIDGYPHIHMLSFDKDYIVKKVNKIYCKDINTLYNYLSKSSYIELPIKTINGEYGVSFKDSKYIVYPRLQEIKGDVESFWWAKALESVHNIEINKNDFKINYDIDQECFELLDKVSELLDDKTKENIDELLKYHYSDNKVSDMVLSHGDPYDSNVMVNHNCVRLIDTDGMRLFPREYDIQKLFFNEVNRQPDLNEIDKYINIFFYNYRNNLDMNLLKKIYVIDLVRTFSWLILITQDKERADYHRQIKELKKYKESILSGRHNKVLKKL